MKLRGLLSAVAVCLCLAPGAGARLLLRAPDVAGLQQAGVGVPVEADAADRPVVQGQRLNEEVGGMAVEADTASGNVHNDVVPGQRPSPEEVRQFTAQEVRDQFWDARIFCSHIFGHSMGVIDLSEERF